MRNRVLRLMPAVLIVLAAACGGGDNGPQGQHGLQTPQDGGRPPQGENVTSAVGQVVIDGEVFGMNRVTRCEPFTEGEDDLDMFALGNGVTIFVYVTHLGADIEMQELGIQGSEVGLYANGAANFGGSWADEYQNALTGPPFQIDGERIRGILTLVEVMEGTETVEVSFDLPIPSDIEDC